MLSWQNLPDNLEEVLPTPAPDDSLDFRLLPAVAGIGLAAYLLKRRADRTFAQE